MRYRLANGRTPDEEALDIAVAVPGCPDSFLDWIRRGIEFVVSREHPTDFSPWARLDGETPWEFARYTEGSLAYAYELRWMIADRTRRKKPSHWSHVIRRIYRGELSTKGPESGWESFRNAKINGRMIVVRYHASMLCTEVILVFPGGAFEEVLAPDVGYVKGPVFSWDRGATS